MSGCTLVLPGFFTFKIFIPRTRLRPPAHHRDHFAANQPAANCNSAKHSRQIVQIEHTADINLFSQVI
jgi:hypothetical protein